MNARVYNSTGAGVLYPFAESDTWKHMYDYYVSETIRIIAKMATESI